MEPITRELVHFLYGLEAKDLGPRVVDRARYLLLDYLGCALRGSLEPSSQAVYRMVARAGGAGPCTVLGTPMRTTVEYAALANGAAAHSIELDDTHQAGSIHLGVVTYPAAIAISEQLGHVDADRFIAAVVAGYEMAARVAMAVQPKEHYQLGFHPTATCGVFGATVTAAKLLRLNEEQMLSAVGIAGSMAAGLLEFLADGSWTKRLHAGLAAKNGIVAAMLAAEGFKGPATVLEGRNGFLAAYSQRPRPEALMEDPGTAFEIMRTAVKPHACCRYMQPGIDALIALASEHNIKPNEVTRVDVAVLEAGWQLVCEPRNRKYEPETVVDAQFSMPFGAAVALLYRDAGLDRFSEENLRSAEVRKLMGRVNVQKDIRIEKNFPKEWSGRVNVLLADGTEYDATVRHPKGDPENPLTWDELRAKFHSLCGTMAAPSFLLDSLQIEV